MTSPPENSMSSVQSRKHASTSLIDMMSQMNSMQKNYSSADGAKAPSSSWGKGFSMPNFGAGGIFREDKLRQLYDHAVGSSASKQAGSGNNSPLNSVSEEKFMTLEHFEATLGELEIDLDSPEIARVWGSLDTADRGRINYEQFRQGILNRQFLKNLLSTVIYTCFYVSTVFIGNVDLVWLVVSVQDVKSNKKKRSSCDGT